MPPAPGSRRGGRHLIQRLGEAASRLAADFRAEHEEFSWAEMIGMRNRILRA